MDDRVSPTGEPHLDPIEAEPWKLAEWSHRLGVPETEIRQLAAQVGPVFDRIKRALEEREEQRLVRDALRRAERDGV